MIKPLRFTTIPSLPALPLESALFLGATGTIRAVEAPGAAATRNLQRLETGLVLELDVVVAALKRIPAPPPPPTTLQDLVRAARQRLAQVGLTGRFDALKRVQTSAVELRTALGGGP
jgi:hypothetical protein